MNRCLMWGLLLVLFALASNVVLAGEDCKEEKLTKCLSTLQHHSLNVLDGIKNAAGENYYCQIFEKEGSCPNNKAFKDCKAKFPKKSNLSSSLYTYLNSFCDNKGKILKDIFPCYSTHRPSFESCWPQKKTDHKTETDQTKEICMDMKYMQCLTKVIKDKCENGKEIKNNVEKYVNNLKLDLKCGAANLWMDFRILAATFFTLLLTRNKF